MFIENISTNLVLDFFKSNYPITKTYCHSVRKNKDNFLVDLSTPTNRGLYYVTEDSVEEIKQNKSTVVDKNLTKLWKNFVKINILPASKEFLNEL